MKKTVLLIGSGVALLASTTWAMTLTRPHCEDSALKSVLTSIVIMGQFLVAAAIVGWFDPLRVWKGLAVGLIGVPIVSGIWIASLWPPRYFGFLWDLFWSMTPTVFLYAMPLCLAGAYGAAVIHRRMNCIAANGSN